MGCLSEYFLFKEKLFDGIMIFMYKGVYGVCNQACHITSRSHDHQ